MSTSPTATISSLKTLGMFGGLMLLGLLVLVWLGTPVSIPAIGQPMPTVDLQPLLNAETPVVNQDLAGKIAVLHFWGTWCPPCRLEFPEFAELATKFEQEPRLVIVSVSCSGGPEYKLDDLRSESESYLSKIAPLMKTYCDPVAMTRGQLALLFEGGTFGYPTTVVVDSQGKIADVVAGYRPGEMQKLAARLEKLLK